MSDDPPRPSIGEYLARQRKLRGISLDELCEITKIPRRNLERLESGALDGVPDGFARGFVRTIAHALGLDVDEAVMRLLEEPRDAARPDPRVLTATHVRIAALLVAGVVLVLLAKGVGGWWASRPVESAGSELVKRQDAVRELLREQRGEVPFVRPADDGREAQGPPPQ